MFASTRARAGLGPSPGWDPVRVGAHMGPYGPIYGPIWALMGPYMRPYGPIWALMGPPGQVLAGPDMSDFRLLIEFCMFEVQTKFLTKLIDDSAWFFLEKRKNM